MQTKEEILKTIKVLILCVIIFIVAFIVYHFIVNWGNHKPKEEPDSIDYSFTNINENYQNPHYCSAGYYIVDDVSTDEVKTVMLDEKLNVIETFNFSQEQIYCLYDHYYLINDQGSYILKRNNSIVAGNINFNDVLTNRLVLYRDNADTSAQYISYLYLYNVINNYPNFIVNDFVYNAYNNEAYMGILYNLKTGTIIDSHLNDAYQISDNKDYLYVQSLNSYLFNTLNETKLLEGKELIFASLNKEKKIVTNNSTNNLIYKDVNGYGIADFTGNIVIPAQNLNFSLTSNNGDYFVVMKNGKYGIINKFGSLALDYNYDFITTTPEFIITVQNKKLVIYNNTLEILTDEYTTKENTITIQQFTDFYQIKNIMTDEENELILMKTGKINLIRGLNYIANSELFYDQPAFLVNQKGSFSVYFNQDEKMGINTKYQSNVTKAIMLNYNQLYTELPTENKIRYNYYRINSGSLIASYTKEKVDVEFEVFKVDKLVFSRENNKISVYYHNNLYDEITADKISHLNANNYVVQQEGKNNFVQIIQK